MTDIYKRTNTDDVFNRVVIIGLLDLMNNKISYEQIWDDNVVEDVHVPTMYDFGSSDERFAQDNYTFFGNSCFGEKKIDGKFDMLPRCALKYTGSQIDSNSITNKSVRGTFMKNENGKLVSYNAMLFSIPLTFNFDAEVWCDNIVTAFKIEQSIRETFYKNRTYNVLYRGMKIPCCVGFPESMTLDKTTSYSFDSERRIKMNFNLAVEAYQPCFSMPIPSANRIEHIGFDITRASANQKKEIYLKLDQLSGLYPSGTNMYISWESKSNVSDICTVCLSYIMDGEEKIISTPSYNNGFYIWHIPEGITGYKEPNITLIETDDVKIYENPIIKIVPDENNNITPDSFVFIDNGIFNIPTGEIQAVIEYINDETSELESSSEYYFEIQNSKLSGRVACDKIMNFKNKAEKKSISIKISYPSDMSIFDKIDNILII